MIQTAKEYRRAAQRLPLGIGYITQRERQAVELYMAGGQPQTIGPIMGIDYRTVEALMRNARDRTAALTNCQLVAMYASRYSRGAVEPVTGRSRLGSRELERAS